MDEDMSDEAVEAFIAGAISGRNSVRDAIYEALLAHPEPFIAVEDVMALIGR